MTTDTYALGRSSAEYERLRVQARIWEEATGRLLDRVELAPGARCLDAGCGPGETMRLMAQRVGPAGHVLGVDVDAELAEQALDMLHGAGHGQCDVAALDLAGDEPIPGAPFDLVYARLLLFHVADPVAILRTLWNAVAPGGHLVVQDYDMRTVDTIPTLDTMREWRRVVLGAFAGAGCDIHAGTRLPALFAAAGIGAPDGTDVAGRLDPVRTASRMLTAVYRSTLPGAVALGLTTEDAGEDWMAAMAADAETHGDRPALWPLLAGAWKEKAA